MAFFEVMYRRIPANVIKESIHSKLYGPQTSQRELTSFLIKTATAAKSSHPDGFTRICSILPAFSSNKIDKTQNQIMETKD